MRYDDIPTELKQLKQWVCCFEHSKAPMRSCECVGASTTDPNQWSGFTQAKLGMSVFGYDYIGFVFNDNGYVGIDIDCGDDPCCLEIYERCQSYSEYSKSGRGLHIIMKGDLPFKGKNNGRGIEIYKTGRYFIMSGNTCNDAPIRADQDTIDWIIETYFKEDVKDRTNPNEFKPNKFYQPKWASPDIHHLTLSPYYPPIPTGERNNSLTSLAGTLRTSDWRASEIYAELLKVNEICCATPIRKSAIESIVKSIMRYNNDYKTTTT